MKTSVVALCLASLGLVVPAWAVPSPRTPADEAPVDVTIVVAPEAVPAGGETSVTVRLLPRSGIKLNKYPKIRLQIPAAVGVVQAAEGSIGAAGPPAADQLEANYYKGSVDPLTVPLRLDESVSKGRHDVVGKLSYFYCVAASGYCAPAKVDVTIPVTVR